jgi:hypothetical protein
MTFSRSKGASPDITFCNSSSVSGVKGRKELGLGNVVFRASDEILYFSTICLFQHPKAPNIERLE